MKNIIVKGARENNLKGVNIEIPRNSITAFVGVSGSGKTSLVFDTVAAESMHQLYDTFPTYVRSRLPVYTRPKAEAIENLTTAIVIDQKPFTGDIRSTVGTMTEIAPKLRLLFSRFADNRLESSSMYSFNDPSGMCPQCSGLGLIRKFDIDRIIDRRKSLNEGAIDFPGFKVDSCFWQVYANSGIFDNDKALEEYTESEWDELMHGDSTRIVEIRNNTGKVWEDSYNLTYEGFLDKIDRLYLSGNTVALSKSKENVIKKYTTECTCPECSGRRLNSKALVSRIGGYNIWELGQMDITDLIDVMQNLKIPGASGLIGDIVRMLTDIREIGLGYLNLNRVSNTLSGGETQRLKLVKHLRSSLIGITYIFDEPGAGLHYKDIKILNGLLQSLRDKGNTVIIVEHNRHVISIADHIVEMGPGAGTAGGEIVFDGTYDELLKAATPTGKWLRTPLHKKTEQRNGKGEIRLIDCCKNNLKHIDVIIPKGILTVITGPSGSGKSTLLKDELMKRYQDIVYIDQKFIGTSNRSNTASYVGIMDEIRKNFAKSSGKKVGMFSYNSTGACPCCKGKGNIVTEMAFMEPVTVRCEACNGMRYCDETLGVRYNGLNISQVMAMTVKEAISFFADNKKIVSKLMMLVDVGMDYITLGQNTKDMSGGECQRLKLAAHIKSKGGIYVLDEPTTGLHGKDVVVLMKLLSDMVDRGNTVIVVEHNDDVISQADWIIELGPQGGAKGGEIIKQGRITNIM